MSVTGWKKKKKLKKILIAGGIIGIPLMVILVVLAGICMDLSDRLKVYEDENGYFVKKTGYVLVNPKKAGEKILETDLKEIQVVGEKETEILSASAKDYVGKCCKADCPAGSLLVKELLAIPESYSQDMREQTFTGIAYSASVQAGEKVDIRISFPTGEDYVVVGKKEVLAAGSGQEDEEMPSQTSLTFCLGEEELLRISSAFIDMDLYPGTYVYALPYVDTFQEQAYITYPINRQVYSLLGWDPNVKLSARTADDFYENEQNLRQTLESNLAVLLEEDGAAVSAKKEEVIQQETIEKEEIEYFP